MSTRKPHTLRVAVTMTVVVDLDSWNAAYGPEPFDSIRDYVRQSAVARTIDTYQRRGVTVVVTEAHQR